MTARDVLARVREMGGRVTLESGGLCLVKPPDPYWRKRLDALLPLLKEHRAAILAHYLGSTEGAPALFVHCPDGGKSDDPGAWCRECERTVWVGGAVTGEDVWRTCGMLMCPHYRAEFDPGGWRDEARRAEQWRRDNPKEGRRK